MGTGASSPAKLRFPFRSEDKIPPLFNTCCAILRTSGVQYNTVYLGKSFRIKKGKEVALSPLQPLQQPAPYHSFLVRLWREQGHPDWRASARSIQTGEEQQFAHLEQLFVFLHTQTADGLPEGIGGFDG